MKILDMPCTKGFMQLAQDGDSTLRERVALLQSHREKVLARMEEM